MLKPRDPIVLAEYPRELNYFQPDIWEIAETAIERYGLEEWTAIVLTCELHRHLGIYSILGAKMGIYAREILNASLDDLRVISYAGNKPPLSCFNDGLQVSTGASLGQGTISVMEDKPAIEAVFMIEDHGIHLASNPDIARQAADDIVNALKRYGEMNKEYFDEIRRIALNYWRDLDRSNIFTVLD